MEEQGASSEELMVRKKHNIGLKLYKHSRRLNTAVQLLHSRRPVLVFLLLEPPVGSHEQPVHCDVRRTWEVGELGPDIQFSGL